ncbi:MAG: hypothetical protein AAF517_28430, partial [Planctomycetota bacterium]
MSPSDPQSSKRVLKSSTQASAPRRNLLALSRLGGRLRRLHMADGSTTFFLAVLAWIVLSFGLDYLLHLPSAVRGIFLVGALGAGFLFLWRRVVSPLSASMLEEDLALLVEEANPTLRQQLITAIQLTRPNSQTSRYVSPALIESVVDDVESRVNEIPFDRIVKLQRLMIRCLAGLAFAVGLGVLSSDQAELASIWYRRNLFLASEDWPRRTTLASAYPPNTVAVGDDLAVKVRVEQGSPRLVEVEREVDGEPRLRAMERREQASWDVQVDSLGGVEADQLRALLAAAGVSEGAAARSVDRLTTEGSGAAATWLTAGDADTLKEALSENGATATAVGYDLYVHEFSNVSEAMSFSVQGGDHRIGPFEIDVRMQPRIDMSSIDVSYRLPDYTGESVEVRKQKHGHLKVPAGTSVDLSMSVNIPVKRAFFVLA